MKIKCKFKNCEYMKNSECTLEVIEMDDYGGCLSAKFIITCGGCAKFGTEKCKWSAITSADESADMSCFEKREVSDEHR